MVLYIPRTRMNYTRLISEALWCTQCKHHANACLDEGGCVCVCKHTKRAKVGTLSVCVWRICDGHILMMRSKGTITSSVNNRRASDGRSLLVLWCRQGLEVVGQGISRAFVYPPVLFLPRGLGWLPLCIRLKKKKNTNDKRLLLQIRIVSSVYCQQKRWQREVVCLASNNKKITKRPRVMSILLLLIACPHPYYNTIR